MNKTNIAWTDFTWNPITGCTMVSNGCKNCYAKAVHERFYDTPFSDIVFHKDRLIEPSKTKKPAKIFVGSMTDLFQDGVNWNMLDEIMKVVINNPQHIFQILTKRADNMKRYFTQRYSELDSLFFDNEDMLENGVIPNLWLGVTAENQETADERIPALIDTPASKRFISIEPMINEITLEKLHRKLIDGEPAYPCAEEYLFDLDWVIVGGETGAKSVTREMKAEWVQRIYEDCRSHNTPFFFKQWGTHKPTEKYFFEDIKEYPNENFRG